MSSAFDRLRKSKWAYVASGWTAFLDNMAKPGNQDIAEVIKNDRDFFAHNEAVQTAKDVGKLRRAIKLAIGRAGAIAYMEQTKREARNEGNLDTTGGQWTWQDFTSRVIDAGLETPKEERHMWVLNCGKLKKGEKIKLPGAKAEYEVIAVDSGGAKVAGLGYIAAEAEVLVWRPGTQFAEKPTAPKTLPRVTGESGVRTISHEELEAIKAKKENAIRKEDSEMVKQTAAVSVKKSGNKPASRTAKSHAHEADSEPNRWQKNDGEVQFRFGMPVRRGNMFGKVIRAHGSKLRVKLDKEGGTVEWSTEDEGIFWKDPIDVRDEAEDEEMEPEPMPKKNKPAPPPEPFDDDEDEDEEQEDEQEEEIEEDGGDDDDEIDPDDLPDDDADLLGEDEEDEPEPFDDDEDQDEEDGDGNGIDDDDDEDEDPDDGGEGDVEGDEDMAYIYNGNDVADKAGVDYQRVQRLKAQGVLDGTWLAASNGRIMYTFEAIERVQNAPRNKPGRPPGGGKARNTRTGKPPEKSRPETEKPSVQKPAPKPDPRQQTIPATPPASAKPAPDPSADRRSIYDRAVAEHADQSAVIMVKNTGPTIAVTRLRSASDIFADTIAELEGQKAQRKAELDELESAIETLKGIARRNR